MLEKTGVGEGRRNNKGERQTVLGYLNVQLEKECNGRKQKRKKVEGKSEDGREGPVRRPRCLGPQPCHVACSHFLPTPVWREWPV